MKKTMDGTEDNQKVKSLAPRLLSDLTKEELQEERSKLLKLLCKLYQEKLMPLGSSSRYHWQGTLTDLVELTHSVWLVGNFTDQCGRPITFSAMVRHVCLVLHCTPPAHPNVFVYQAKNRKGVRGLPVIERYVKLNVEGRLRNPMWMDIKFI